jgi:hypothetical protein
MVIGIEIPNFQCNWVALGDDVDGLFSSCNPRYIYAVSISLCHKGKWTNLDV